MVDNTDDHLLRLLRQGDHRAFTEIYNRYWQKLFSVAANKLRDLMLAEELVQDIFLDLWKRKAELNVSGSLQAYLAVAVKYKVIDIRVKMNRQADYRRQAADFFLPADHSTEENLHFEDLKDRLALFVDKLPEKCRLIYKLSKEEGHSRKEIARQLQISEKTVESHLYRAMKIIRTGLSQFLLSIGGIFLL